MFSALLSAVAAAGGLIIDKITLSRRHVPLKVFLPISFTLLFVLTLIFTPLYGYINWSTALLSNNLFLAMLMVVIAVAWNVLVYQNIQKESVHQHEMMIMTSPIITVVMAAVFFREEFSLPIFVLAVVASLAVFFARAERHHFSFDKNSYNLFLAVVLMSVESLIIRELLFSYSPVSLYAIRTLIIGVFFWLYYRPTGKEVWQSPMWLIALSSAVGAGSMIGRFYAFNELGIIFTTLIATLSPLIVFIGSWEILHERIRPRVIAASAVILACVAWATVLSSR